MSNTPTISPAIGARLAQAVAAGALCLLLAAQATGTAAAKPVQPAPDPSGQAVPTSTFRPRSLSVALPHRAGEGIRVAVGSDSITLGLPAATQSKPATTHGRDLHYRTTKSFTNVVRKTDDGVQVLALLDSKAAPESFTYRVAVPAGGRVVVQSDGSALVLNSRGVALLAAKKPWAVDAKGMPVATHYVAGSDGKSLIQVVQHRGTRAHYPITADPTWVSKTWAFVQCIFGVGVPIGAAWAMVADPALWAYFLRIGPLPASAGRWGYGYVTWLRNVCSYALF